MQQTQETAQEDVQEEEELSTFASVAGGVLGVSYPVLALSTGARAAYQLFLKEGVTDYVPPLLTAVAALLYLVATVGFTRRRRWAWRVSVAALSVETFFTLVVGTISLINYDLVGHNAWTYFGMDYAFFPLVQPLLGLAWLLHPTTLRAYKIR